MTRVVRGALLFGVYTTLLSLAQIHVHIVPEEDINDITDIFTFLGVVLSILMVFRTNAAYDRWWEGRKQWGALVNNCRNMANYIHAMYAREDEQSRRYFAKGISNFCLAFVEHLRNGTKLELLIELTEDEKVRMERKDHVPNYISGELFRKLEIDYKEGHISDMDILNIRPTHQSLLDILGACERIKKTPIPFGHAVLVKIFITSYGILLPVALVPDLGYWSIPAMMIIMFAFLGVEMLGAEIEEPFGLDCNDLPTHTIANTIRDNVFEILEVPPSCERSKPAELYEKVF